MKHIVVGVDGSQASREAARWAVDRARESGAVLEVVHAWSAPEMGASSVTSALASPDNLEQAARRELRDVLDQVDERGLVAPITTRVTCGDALSTMVRASRHADLVVVGRRGLSGGQGDCLGTVSGRLIQEAACPVVVVPA